MGLPVLGLVPATGLEPPVPFVAPPPLVEVGVLSGVLDGALVEPSVELFVELLGVVAGALVGWGAAYALPPVPLPELASAGVAGETQSSTLAMSAPNTPPALGRVLSKS
jgi:hypothetical protein